MAIDHHNGKDIKNHLSLRFLVLNKHSLSLSFILFLQRFIRDVIITDSVLTSISAFNMMKFQNKFQDYDLSHEENAKINNLKRRMILMCMTIIEHEYLFFAGAIFTEEPDLAMFRYKKENKELLMKMQLPENVY